MFHIWARYKNLLLKSLLPIVGVFVLLGIAYFLFRGQEKKHGVIEIGRNDESGRGHSPESLVTERKTVAVYVAGGVVSPGVYEIHEKSRVIDAISAAGGFSPDADMRLVERSLNLAQEVVDGTKIYVPRLGDTVLSEDLHSQNSGRVNINNASKEELMKLKGIGEVYSEKIIEGRPYRSIEELVEKGVIPKSTFEKIKDQITV